MKNISIILNVVLIIAVGTLYYFQFSGSNCKPTEDVTTSVETDNTSAVSSSSDIAFVISDSLVLNYKLQAELEEKFAKRQKIVEGQINRLAQKYRNKEMEIQEKVQNGIIISQQSMERAQNELLNLQNSVVEESRGLEYDLGKEKEKMNLAIFDSVINIISEINSDNKYRYVLTSDILLYKNQSNNITDTVLSLLNQRYDELNAVTEEE